MYLMIQLNEIDYMHVLHVGQTYSSYCLSIIIIIIEVISQVGNSTSI